METALNTQDREAQNESPDAGKSLDEIYSETSEQRYYEKFTHGVDFLMAQYEEGLI